MPKRLKEEFLQEEGVKLETKSEIEKDFPPRIFNQKKISNLRLVLTALMTTEICPSNVAKTWLIKIVLYIISRILKISTIKTFFVVERRKVPFQN